MQSIVKHLFKTGKSIKKL